MKQSGLIDFSALLSVLLVLSLVWQTPGEEFVIRPRPKAGPLDNPLKGWCPDTDAGKIHQPYSMVFQYISWRELEPFGNDYRFDEWEKSWNVGVAPFYYPWKVELALFDPMGKMVALQATDWDIRKWQSGEFSEDVQLTFDVPPGAYRLGLGIRDPWQDRPAIRFANELPVRDGWTILSEIQVAE